MRSLSGRILVAGTCSVLLTGICATEAFSGSKDIVKKGRITGKTVIISDRASFDYARSIAVFEGNVEVADPEVKMKSDKLTLLFDGTNDVRSATAVGNVNVRHLNKTATCRKAIYIAESGEIIMTGNVILKDGPDTVSGRIVHVWVDEEKMTVEPGRVIIYPKKQKTVSSGEKRGGGR